MQFQYGWANFLGGYSFISFASEHENDFFVDDNFFKQASKNLQETNNFIQPIFAEFSMRSSPFI